MNKFPHLEKYVEVLLHVSAWLLIMGLIYNNYIQDTKLIELPVGLSQEEVNSTILYRIQHSKNIYVGYFPLTLFKAIFFYINVFLIFPRYNQIKPRWKVLLPLLFNFFWCFLAEVIVYGFFRKNVFSYLNKNDFGQYRHQELDCIFLFLIALLCSYAYWATKQWLLNKDEFERSSKTNAELVLLKNQVNPHFLFNTLNNLFAMAIERKADDLAESIAQLTNLMRYSIYESQTEYIELFREITYLENYIKLQQLRFTRDDTVTIRFEVENENPHVRIAPMLLINFVENAFKHGVSLKQPSFITIYLRTSEDQINFTVENSIHRQNQASAVAHAGFGLEHTQKLLQMQYPQRHTLQVTDVNGIYKIQLQLKLQRTKVEVLA